MCNWGQNRDNIAMFIFDSLLEKMCVQCVKLYIYIFIVLSLWQHQHQVRFLWWIKLLNGRCEVYNTLNCQRPPSLPCLWKRLAYMSLLTMLSYCTLPCSLNFPTTSFCPIPSSPWRPLHFLLVTIMEEQRDGLPVSQAGKEGTSGHTELISSFISLSRPHSPRSGQCWEDAGKSLLLHLLTPGAGCAPRDALFELVFYRMETKQILNLWAAFVQCCSLVGCCVEKHWYIGDMWGVHVQKHVVTDVVVQKIIMRALLSVYILYTLPFKSLGPHLFY